MKANTIEIDILEFGWRAERHMARENGGDEWQRLAILRGRTLNAVNAIPGNLT